MTGVLVVTALALISLFYISAPLRRANGGGVEDETAELEEQKRRALVAILELEDERDVGKLSESDFLELKSNYEVEALAALRLLDAGGDAPADDPLEREIAKVRARLTTTCASCGASRRPGPEPCPRCGA